MLQEYTINDDVKTAIGEFMSLDGNISETDSSKYLRQVIRNDENGLLMIYLTILKEIKVRVSMDMDKQYEESSAGWSFVQLVLKPEGADSIRTLSKRLYGQYCCCADLAKECNISLIEMGSPADFTRINTGQNKSPCRHFFGSVLEAFLRERKAPRKVKLGKVTAEIQHDGTLVQVCGPCNTVNSLA